jgi:hypothetical protein
MYGILDFSAKQWYQILAPISPKSVHCIHSPWQRSSLQLAWLFHLFASLFWRIYCGVNALYYSQTPPGFFFYIFLYLFFKTCSNSLIRMFWSFRIGLVSQNTWKSPHVTSLSETPLPFLSTNQVFPRSDSFVPRAPSRLSNAQICLLNHVTRLRRYVNYLHAS